MKAKETQLLKFMQTTQQLIIPIYQRTYSWTEAECQQLWDDIVRATDESVSGHFVGSVVYVERGQYQVSSVSELLVIDGQQRLTTVSLLLTALGQAIESTGDDGEITRRRLDNYYLFNAEEEGQQRYKLLLTRGDRDTLISLLDRKPLPEKPSARIVENYRFFENQIRASGIGPGALYRGIAKLMIVDIALNREHDNPQLIFESLNSTGLALSQADLIRNYVLMGLEPAEQSALYEDYWFRMEQSFGQAEYSERFDRFMRDYLTIKTDTIPIIQRVYATFKTYLAGRGGQASARETVAEIARLSTYWARIAGLRQEPDPELQAALSDIGALKVEVSYPFLLQVYTDYTDGRLTRDELLAILPTVESYVFRRAICGIPTNTLNRTFAGLAREINKDDYLLSFQVALLQKDSYRRFPSDAEFRQELVVRDIYSLRTRNYLLDKLENHGRKEQVNVASFTIEHVLPQNPELSAEWRAELGPEWQTAQARVLHTLGNITLTGYNSELSDRSFCEKRDMVGGFRDSPLRLNRSLANRESWNEGAILERANELADTAMRVWRYPELPAGTRIPSPARPVAKPGSTLEEHFARWQPELRPLFEELRKRVLNIDASVREIVNQRYIAYRAESNFLKVRGRQTGLLLHLLMPPDELQDPQGLSQPVRGTMSRVMLQETTQLDAVMDLVCQAFEWRTTGEGAGDRDGLDDEADFDEIDGADEVTLESVQRMLRRIEVPEGQRLLYRALHKANGRWVALPDLAAEMGRDSRGLPGLLGALGRRINDTPGLGRDADGQPRGISAIMDVAWPSTSGTGEWMYRMKPVLRDALEAEGLV